MTFARSAFNQGGPLQEEIQDATKENKSQDKKNRTSAPGETILGARVCLRRCWDRGGANNTGSGCGNNVKSGSVVSQDVNAFNCVSE